VLSTVGGCQVSAFQLVVAVFVVATVESGRLPASCNVQPATIAKHAAAMAAGSRVNRGIDVDQAIARNAAETVSKI
jgi:hypothetical protein